MTLYYMYTAIKRFFKSNTKLFFCVAARGGACTPMPRTQSPSKTYTGSALRKPLFLRRWGGGACPPHTTQNHSFESPTEALNLTNWFRHQRDARSSLFGNHNEIRRLWCVWTPRDPSWSIYKKVKRKSNHNTIKISLMFSHWVIIH